MTSSPHILRLVDLQAQYASIRDEVEAAIADVLREGIFVGGPPVDEFAASFAAYCGASQCIPCGNGTDALELILAGLDIGPGDEIILPAFSFVATLEAVCNAGATPVLCDIERDYFTLDVQQAEALVTSRTRMIMPVHLYGQSADMEAVQQLADRRGLLVVEDAAQAHGATWRGRRLGSIGKAGGFSFYPGKNLGAYGDAGAVITSDAALAARVRKLANHGRLTKYEHDLVGRNSRLDTIQAAILSVKLRHLEGWIVRRQRLAEAYTRRLEGIRGLVCPRVRPDGAHAFHLFTIRVLNDRRDDLRVYLADAGIETGVHYPKALHRLTVTTGPLDIHMDCPVAEQASAEVLALPMFPEMTPDQLEHVCRVIERFFSA